MCIEIACIPIRIGLVYFSLPSVILAFTPASNWTAVDTQRSLIAWFVTQNPFSRHGSVTDCLHLAL
jgi:hypothetical protein